MDATFDGGGGSDDMGMGDPGDSSLDDVSGWGDDVWDPYGLDGYNPTQYGDQAAYFQGQAFNPNPQGYQPLPVAAPTPPANRPRPGLGQALRTILDPLGLFHVSGVELGAPVPPMPEEAYNELPTSAHMALQESRMAEPYGVLQQAPALLGAQMLLQNAQHVASTYPDVSASLADILATAMRILDAELARLLGMQGAGDNIRRARNSGLARVAQAFRIAEGLAQSRGAGL